MQGWRKDRALLTGVVGTGYQSHNDKGLTVMAMKLWTSFCDGIDWVRILNQLVGIYLFHPSRPPDPCHSCGPPKASRLHINEGWFRSLVNHHFPGLNCCFMGWLYIPAHPRYAPLKSCLSHMIHHIFDKISDKVTRPFFCEDRRINSWLYDWLADVGIHWCWGFLKCGTWWGVSSKLSICSWGNQWFWDIPMRNTQSDWSCLQSGRVRLATFMETPSVVPNRWNFRFGFLETSMDPKDRGWNMESADSIRFHVGGHNCNVNIHGLSALPGSADRCHQTCFAGTCCSFSMVVLHLWIFWLEFSAMFHSQMVPSGELT